MDAKALLDELMGKERNVPLDQRCQRRLRYDDPAVCKYDLGGLCPHGLFKNTRSDLGPCEYETHTDHIDWSQFQADYDKQDDREKERYEKKLLRYLEDLIREMDRKIAKSKDRADKESAPKPIKADDQALLDDLQQRAREALEKSQALGEEGDVDQALMLSQQADAYKKQHEEMYKRLSAPDRVMTVCDICGVFINSTDNDSRRLGGKIPQPVLVRLAAQPGGSSADQQGKKYPDHLNGKQYLGWKAIREHHTKLVEKYSAPRKAVSAPPEEGEQPPVRERERERERSPARREEPRREERPRGDDRHASRGGDRGGYDRGRDDRGRDDRGYERPREREERPREREDYRGSGGRDSRAGGRERDRYPEDRRR